jgi:hypothetical protein
MEIRLLFPIHASVQEHLANPYIVSDPCLSRRAPGGDKTSPATYRDEIYERKCGFLEFDNRGIAQSFYKSNFSNNQGFAQSLYKSNFSILVSLFLIAFRCSQCFALIVVALFMWSE